MNFRSHRQDIKKLCRAICAIFAVFALSETALSSPVIYQAFEETFANLETKLDRLAEDGFTHIQISPPQKSLAAPDWWAKYQPVDHTVLEGPLGNEAGLISLINAAHQKNLKIIVDAVLNHMADPTLNNGQLVFKEFDRNDFHFPDTKPCITNYRDRFQVTHYWMCNANQTRSLPDLDTSSPKVRSILKAYIERLIAMGVDGFRFDAMKHIEPEFWADMVNQIKGRNLFYYGEVIGETIDESRIYTPFMPVTDFNLLAEMLKTFTFGGDLRNLYNPEGSGRSLEPSRAVVFSRNHDTVMNPSFFNFGDYTDAMLANAFVIGRGKGFPMIFRDDAENPLVHSALLFHNLMDNQSATALPTATVCDSENQCNPRTLMFMARGDRGLMVMNITSDTVDIQRVKLDILQPGCYQSVEGAGQFKVVLRNDGHKWVESTNQALRNGLVIPPRSALFYTNVSGDQCH